jgi:hypothetical protein
MGRRKTFKVSVTTGVYDKLKHAAELLGLSVEDYVHDLVTMSN